MKLLFTLILTLFVCCYAHAQSPPSVDELLEGIKSRCSNLTYVSGTDAAVYAFIAPREVSAMSASNFIRANHYPPLTTIYETNYDDFLIAPIRLDENWQILKEYLDTYLLHRTVFTIPINARETQKEVYIVGLYFEHIVGVKTFEVDT